MAWKTIEKPRNWAVRPNLLDYEETRASFSWDNARRALDGLPGGRGLNIAHEAVDRHIAGPLRRHLALRWLGRKGDIRNFTYDDLHSLTNRFANVLKRLGVARGERVFLLAGRIPELYISALGTLKGGQVFCPLFSAFGPEPIRQRIGLGDGRVLVTTVALYKRKVAELRTSLPCMRLVLLIGDAAEIKTIPNTYDFNQLMAEADDRFEVPPTDPEDLALLHFTSGTTGTPKGAMHVHRGGRRPSRDRTLRARLASGDIFWCTADPGWVTGTSYGIIAPLTHRYHQHRRRGRLRRRALVRNRRSSRTSRYGTRRRPRCA